MIHCGHRKLLVEKPLKCKNIVQPELTWNEYLRLLSTAQTLGTEQLAIGWRQNEGERLMTCKRHARPDT